MNTGHEGGLTTVHANDPASALVRLMTLAKQGDPTLSEDTIRSKIAAALDLVVQVQRMSDGTRRITSIEAIGGNVDGHIQHEQLFYFERNDDGGIHRCCHLQPPRIRQLINDAGYVYDPAWFLEDQGELS